jgi:hypothetical protein
MAVTPERVRWGAAVTTHARYVFNRFASETVLCNGRSNYETAAWGLNPAVV